MRGLDASSLVSSVELYVHILTLDALNTSGVHARIFTR